MPSSDTVTQVRRILPWEKERKKEKECDKLVALEAELKKARLA